MSYKQPLLQSDGKDLNQQSFADPYLNSALEPDGEGPVAFNQNSDGLDLGMSDYSNPGPRKRSLDVERRNLNKECNNSKECSNLKEPEFCTSSIIQSLENEYKSLLKDEIVKKPVSIYLKNCERFARQNLHLQILNVHNYRIGIKDLPYLHPKFVYRLEIKRVSMGRLER